VSIESLSSAEWLIIVGAGILAGFINTVAGGGSLLTLPALMLAGLPPSLANGTNRIGIVFQSASATLRFYRAGSLDLKLCGELLLPTLIGALAGAYLATLIEDAMLEPLILGVLLLIALLFTLRPSWVAPSAEQSDANPLPRPLVWMAFVCVGFYGGFLQAGVGFLLLSALAGMLRLDLARANAIKVALVLPYTAMALVIFVWAGHVAWTLGFILAFSSVLGARLGVHVALTRTHWLRWLVLAAVIASALALILPKLK